MRKIKFISEEKPEHTVNPDKVNFIPKTFIDEYLVVDNLVNDYNVSIYDIYSIDTYWQQLFKPLDFFNLLYKNYAIVDTYKKRPLAVKDYLLNLDLSEDHLLYFLHYLLNLLSVGHFPDYECFGDPDLMNCHHFIEIEYNKLEKKLTIIDEDPFRFYESPSKFRFENVKKHLKSLNGIDEKINFLLKISTDFNQHKSSWPWLGETFFEKCILEIAMLEKLLGLKTPQIIKSKLHHSENADTENRIHEDQDSTAIITTKPTFNPDAIQPFYNLLKNHFDKQHHTTLQELLNTGETTFKPLIFLDSGNRLADAFKQLKDRDIITGCTKKVLEKWILDHFEYSHKQKTKKFTTHYLNDIISSKHDKCQNPLLNVILNKESGQYQITKV